MEQVEVKYAPGMRIIVRGEEWMVKKVETNSLGNQTLHVIGISQLVKDYESMFLVDVEDDIEIVDPAKVTLVPDNSAFFRKSKVYIESQWRGKIPTDNKIHIGNKAAMDLMSYQLEPAQMALNKTIAVITDNDHEQTKIDDANEFNLHNEKQHVFMGETMEDWTWEACVYNCNKEKLDTMIQVQDGAEYLFHRTNYGQVLGKMLNNKVDTAYQMLISEEDFVIPGYVEEAIEWLNE